MRDASLKIASVDGVQGLEGAFSLEESVLPCALVASAVVPLHFANSILDSVLEGARVLVLTHRNLCAEAVLHIVGELALVDHFLVPGDVLALPVALIVLELTLVAPAIGLDENSPSVRHVILPSPIVGGPIFKGLLSQAMALAVLVLTLIKDPILELELHNAILEGGLGNRAGEGSLPIFIIRVGLLLVGSRASALMADDLHFDVAFLPQDLTAGRFTFAHSD